MTAARLLRTGGPDRDDLLGVDEAREIVLAACAALPAVAMPLDEALGLVLAEEIVAARDVPPFTNSAMDGFACRAADLAAASAEHPVQLRIAGTVLAGERPGAALEPSCAIRIMTGAPLPAGADVVVAFERTDFDDRTVRIRHIFPPGTNTRPAGEDLRAGEIVLRSGRRLRPAEIALLAAAGRGTVAVHRRPRVAILATGDEIVTPGEMPGPGQIWDSNSPALAAMVWQAGGIPVPLGIVRDRESAIRERLAAAAKADLIVTSGGVSAGDLDLIKEILQVDAAIAFWQIRIKPGRPLAFGAFGGIPLFGMPGNPVAAFVTFLQFVRPAILKQLGRSDLALPRVRARMLDRIENFGGRRHYVRVYLTETGDGYEARLAGAQGSAVLSSLAEADGLLVIPETMAVVEPGTILPVELLD